MAQSDGSDLAFAEKRVVNSWTLVGPAFLGVGYGEGERRNYYFALGRRF